MEINKITKSIEVAGKTITFETGFMAMQAHGSTVVRCGDTAVLATVVGADPREGLDFFPLSVEFEERLYAGGIIKGSRWVKREGRPGDQAILNARVIDRSIRPLFPKNIRNDVQVVITVLSVDEENDAAILGMLATSASLKMSGLPWSGPIASVRVGLVDDQLVINPAVNVMDQSKMDLIVSGTKDNVLMVEMGGQEVPYEKILDAIFAAHDEIKKITNVISDFADEANKAFGVKFELEESEPTPEEIAEKEALERIHNYILENYPETLLDANNATRNKVEAEFLKHLFSQFEGKVSKSKMKDEFNAVSKKKMRAKVINEKKRIDGREITEVRPITIEIGPLARTHGSAIFQRGETQALTVATLGSTSLSQIIEGVRGEQIKRYIHHYNFPPYSTGETGRVGSPKRREIGHGALAERALKPVIPTEEQFPYTIRLVSEILGSNGSSSMAATCGSTLALMDAGVPIKSPVSGIAMGLIKEGEDFVVLSDIMGVEDFYGDMDFKVAGTKDGITALQMDVKLHGLSREVFEVALKQAEEGRAFILNEMLKAIDQPRENLSVYAPKILSIKINPKKIGDLIGPGGKVIRAIQEETETDIDVAEDGMVHVSGINPEGLKNAMNQVEMLTKEVQAGEIYDGKVVRLMDFGAFVEILPGKDGLVHISELAPGFVKNVTDVVKEGDEFKVKVLEIDDQGRINLSRKALMGDQTAGADKPVSQGQGDRQNKNQHNNDNTRPQNDSKPRVYRMDRGGNKGRHGGKKNNQKDNQKSNPDHNQRS